MHTNILNKWLVNKVNFTPHNVYLEFVKYALCKKLVKFVSFKLHLSPQTSI